jgi:hypothetical protein
MFAELVKDSIGVVSAAIALATAWIGYRAAKKTAIANRDAKFKVLKIEDSGVRQKPWSMRRLRWVGVLGALPALVLGITGFEMLGPALSVLNIAMGLGLIALIALLRTEPPSRTRKHTRLELQLSVEAAMEACFRAATDMGAQIAKYDATSGVLIAKTGLSWRSFGEIITVKVFHLDQKRCEVQIESDVVQVSVLFDWGANRRNVRHLSVCPFRRGSLCEVIKTSHNNCINPDAQPLRCAPRLSASYAKRSRASRSRDVCSAWIAPRNESKKPNF